MASTKPLLNTRLNYQFLNPYWVDSQSTKNQNYSQPVPRRQAQIQLNKYNYSNYAKNYQYNNKKPTLQFLKLYTKNSQLKKLWIFELKDSSLSNLNNNVYNQMHWSAIDQRQFTVHLSTYDSLAHTYIMYAQLQNDSMWIVKKFTLLPNHEIMMVLNKTRLLSERELFNIDRMAKILGRVPFTQFTDTPTIAGSISINPVNSKITKLEGLIIGPGIEYPVNKAFIVLEQNGIYKYGAWSNSQGRFLIENIVPGNYMMKIKAEQYHYWINYNVQIAAAKNSLALIKLKLHSQYSYSATVTTQGAIYNYVDAGSPTSPSHAWTSADYSNMAEEGSYDLVEVTAGKKETRRLAAVSRNNAEIKDAEGKSIRGSRTDGNGTYIDGMRDIAGGNLQAYNKEDKDADGVLDVQKNEPNDDYLELVEEMANNKTPIAYAQILETTPTGSPIYSPIKKGKYALLFAILAILPLGNTIFRLWIITATRGCWCKM